MNINIFGSTGIIGTKTLNLIDKFFPNIKINLISANNNYKKLIIQSKKFKPKYIFLKDKNKIKILKKNINNNIKIFSDDELNDFLKNTKSDLSILAISGYKSLDFFEQIIKNTKNLGLVNKECVVSAGHLFKKLIKKSNVKLFPLDSEHFSLFNEFNNRKLNYKKIILTASGGPFFIKSINEIYNAKFNEVIKHPKWKMGFKNSVDSASLANKCLELIEAHYLFNIPFNKLEAIIHPEALIHSIIENVNMTSNFNYFYHDMDIPIINFLSYVSKNKKNISIPKYNLNNNFKLNFYEIDINIFPVFNIFKKLNKFNPVELIKFNLANEFAVNLLKRDKIKFGQIYNIIDESLSFNTNYSVDNLDNIIAFQKIYNNLLKDKYVYY